MAQQSKIWNDEFNLTEFSMLMQRRIYRILLVCSNYDFFMLEEDGRIDEQLFDEYTNLGMRFPPAIVQTDSSEKAFEILQSDDIDLVIMMQNISGPEPVDLAKQIKKSYQQIPIVLLTHFSSEISLLSKADDIHSIDYVFNWLGNADLLLAIVKLIEDRMNADHDVLQIGVQTIMLVEDSVRYISRILPVIYKTIIQQSRDFMREGLNEHQKMLRLRGRPKVLLAQTYDEASCLYEKYGQYMLGIISDISFKKNKQKTGETQEGLKLCRLVRHSELFMPFLIQSSDESAEKFAIEHNAGFINKNSKSLSVDLRNYILKNFGFGDFVFRDPDTNREVARAADLADLQHTLSKIPAKVLAFHAGKNEISKWLNARGLFAIGRIFKALSLTDFNNIEEARDYLINGISRFRLKRGHGIIASYNEKVFDEYLTFSRIGDGSLGGKGRGLAFIDALIKKYNLVNQFENVQITIPRTVVISTDLFDEFMESNNLFEIARSDKPDEVILEYFVKAPLPNRLNSDLLSFAEAVSKPIVIRSSSKLEDSRFLPFAGIFSTYMVPYVKGSIPATAKMIADAIKCVYASLYFKSSKSYITSTANIMDEEKMAVILEEVCGQRYGNMYYPALSGVARSMNFYPLPPELPGDGIAYIAFGLGKYVVDGGQSLRFSPKYPKKIIQLSNPDTILKETQKSFYALDLDPEKWSPSIDDKINLIKLDINDAENNSALKYAISWYDHESNRVSDMRTNGERKVVTFSNILNYNVFPLASVLQTLLEISQKEMNNPIEIEFAVDLDRPEGEPKIFNFLQIRPIIENDQKIQINLKNIDLKKALVYSKKSLGNGIYSGISDFVYVRSGEYSSNDNYRIVEEVDRVNNLLRIENRNYVLAGHGRWGSSDPWLGIPVKWAQISEARIIIEANIENTRIEPSQGSHFFQNLTGFKVGYLTVNPKMNEGFINFEFLDAQPALYENQYIRIIRFKKPLNIQLDGRKSEAVILKS